MRQHVIKKNETPEILSAIYGIPVCMLARANGFEALRPGMRINIPSPSICTGEREYVVQRGDNVYSIARQFGITMRMIMEANHLSKPDELTLGRNIIIPSLPLGCTIFVVKATDTRESIVKATGMSWREIEQMNGGLMGVYPGMQIIVRGKR